MGTFALHNILRLKSRDSYSRKGSSDKIRNNISLLLGEWRENPSSNTMNDLKRAGKTELKCRKNSNFITGECHQTRTSPFVLELERSDRIIKYLNCVDNNSFSPNEIQCT